MTIAEKLLGWYDRHARALPWRGAPTPYQVWVSEIMLQQTRVETVLDYYRRWMERFPTLADLAAAEQQAVLQVWEGLGYYSRARNLHKAAQQVMMELGGEIPSERKALEQLPGIGRYTAAMIASIAFGQDEAALDGNIRRVLSRLFNLELSARSREGEKQLWAWAEEILAPGRAGDHNQALMDLGSSICTPTSPQCLLCPLRDDCEAARLGLQEERPVLEKKKALPHKLVAAAIITREDGKILLARRPEYGLLGGLWEFPGGKTEDGETLPEALRREIIEELGAEIKVGVEFGVYQHTFTHFRITLHAFECELSAGEPQAIEASEIAWLDAAEMDQYPMGKVDRQIAMELLERAKAA
ncbi:MAG: A/G-specific adenine glycosylase [Anaerolineaceae bacterium]|nr:A/G-specific adenine glycosylase [Anaerolineaceae bacterium]